MGLGVSGVGDGLGGWLACWSVLNAFENRGLQQASNTVCFFPRFWYDPFIFGLFQTGSGFSHSFWYFPPEFGILSKRHAGGLLARRVAVCVCVVRVLVVGFVVVCVSL